MVLPILYSFRRCPYAIRARWALRYAGVRVALREVVLRDKPEALRAASPKATVPVLQLPSGVVLDESLQIMEWALAQNDPDGWATTGDVEQGRALITRNDGPFKQLLDRYKYPNRELAPHEAKDRQRVLAAQTAYRAEAMTLHLAPLEQRLQASPYLLADRVALCDIALVPFVRQFAHVDWPWFSEASQLPALRRWMQQLLDTPLFEQLMNGVPPWQPGDPETLF